MADGRQYTFIDLFAGLGGFHLALEQLGCKCVFASELREDLRKQYEKNFKIKPFGDITKVDIKKDIPPHDILCAGFPCQPFSQAGKRQGFDDNKDRGNLFFNIWDILECHRPKFLILENVQNLKNHDNGKTWKIIKETLGRLYYIKESIISPHEIGIAQHRKRIYIVGVLKQKASRDLEEFVFLERSFKFNIDVNKLIDAADTNYVPLKSATRYQLKVWQEFISLVRSNGLEVPRFPIWAMEFGATYNYTTAPFTQKITDLVGERGHLGNVIKGDTLEECLSQLPVYAQNKTAVVFPQWKMRYIEQNRAFYQANKTWLDPWLEKVKGFKNSHLKLEWNCGNNTSSIYDNIIQFRASGIRVKAPTFCPALNLVGTQIPIFPWVKLPDVKDGEPDTGRYMTVKEAAKIQGLEKLDFSKLTLNRRFEALGNAVNAKIVRMIAQRLFNY